MSNLTSQARVYYRKIACEIVVEKVVKIVALITIETQGNIGSIYLLLRQYSGCTYAWRKKSTKARILSGKCRRCANTA